MLVPLQLFCSQGKNQQCTCITPACWPNWLVRPASCILLSGTTLNNILKSYKLFCCIFMDLLGSENNFCHTKWPFQACLYLPKVTLRTRPSNLLVRCWSHFNYFVLKGKSNSAHASGLLVPLHWTSVRIAFVCVSLWALVVCVFCNKRSHWCTSCSKSN